MNSNGTYNAREVNMVARRPAKDTKWQPSSLCASIQLTKGGNMNWLATKRYVVFSDKANRWVSLTTTGMKRWKENGRHFSGPMPQQEAVDHVAWLNTKKPI